MKSLREKSKAWKVVKVAGAAVAGLTLLVLAAALILVARPQLVLNDHSLRLAANYARRQGIVDASWETARLDVESPALLRKRVRLRFEGLCVRPLPADSAAGNEGCLERADLAFEASLAGFKPRLTEIGPITIEGGRVRVLSRAEPPHSTPPKDPEGSAGGAGFAMPELLRETRILPVNVEVESFLVEEGDMNGKPTGASQAGSLSVRSRSEGGGSARVLGKLRLESRSVGTARPTRVQAELDLLNPKGHMELGAWKAKLAARATLPDGSRGNVDGDVSAREANTAGAAPLFDYSLAGGFRRGGKAGGTVAARATGVAGPDRIEAELAATARGLVPSVPVITVRGCKLGIARSTSPAPLAPESPDPGGTASADCPVRLSVPLPPKGFPDIKMPTELGLKLVANLKTGTYPPTPGAMIDGRVGVELDPVLSPVFEGEGSVRSALSGIPTEFPQGWTMDTDLGLKVRVPRFQKLVAQLANTPWDVWAPARVLDGEIAFAVEGRFDATHGTAPVKLRTRLASKGSGKSEASGQKLDVDADGTLRLDRFFEGDRPSPKMHLDLDVALTDVKIQLPPLPEPPSPTSARLDQLPRFFPDSRIHAPITNFEKKPNSTLTYAVNIATPGARPVQLKTRLAKAPIPIAVRLALSDSAPPSGTVGIRPFPLNLFKQDVQLQYFNIGLETPTQNSPLDGQITVPFGDYTISVLVLGSIGKPVVRLRSDPPLPEDQILAVLLYGKPLDSLDPDQTSSVGNANAALVSGALNLGALYYLSALPIQRVDWDPSTGNASIAFTLGEGTSLRLNQEQGERSVGIRRRLTKNWAVTTQLNNPSDQTDRSVTALLEWAYQY